MAIILQTVQPGQVITSFLFNQIILKIQELEQKIAAGPGTGPQVIMSLDPPTEQAIQGKLTINGNFDTPLNANIVTIDSTVIPASNFLPGSDSTHIIFFIPSSIVVPPSTKKPVTIRVQTLTKGVGQREGYLIRPPDVGPVPTPIPVNITGIDNPLGNNIVEVGRNARIAGQNLAPSPTVAFVALQNGVEVKIPATVSNAMSGQIDLTVPNVPGVEIGPVSTTVEVSIPGAGAPGFILNVVVLAP